VTMEHCEVLRVVVRIGNNPLYDYRIPTLPWSNTHLQANHPDHHRLVTFRRKHVFFIPSAAMTQSNMLYHCTQKEIHK